MRIRKYVIIAVNQPLSSSYLQCSMGLFSNINKQLRRVTETEFIVLETAGECIERDRRGIKVLKLENGQFLKLFRVKRWYSSANWNDYTARFSRNAEQLIRLGIPTIDVKELVRLPHLQRTGIIYNPLEGKTYRDIIKEGPLTRDQIAAYAEFIAHMHQLGVYFRSLHLGNIVITERNDLGLIDIADMRFYKKPLSITHRLRNFSHLFRYTGDIKALTNRDPSTLVDTYIKACNLQPSKTEKLATRLSALLARNLKN